MALAILRRRVDFLRVRGGTRWVTPSFVLEAKARPRQEPGGVPGSDAVNARFGFTVTKRLGAAVVRNRIRRRLREAVRLSAGPLCKPEFDYVLVAKEGALRRTFCDLQADVSTSLLRVHATGRERGEGARESGRGRPPRA